MYVYADKFNSKLITIPNGERSLFKNVQHYRWNGTTINKISLKFRDSRTDVMLFFIFNTISALRASPLSLIPSGAGI